MTKKQKQKDKKSGLEELWQIVGHMLDRERAIGMALGTLRPEDFPDDAGSWDYLAMRLHIAETLSQTLKFDKALGEGGRENDPSVR